MNISMIGEFALFCGIALGYFTFMLKGDKWPLYKFLFVVIVPIVGVFLFLWNLSRIAKRLAKR